MRVKFVNWFLNYLLPAGVSKSHLGARQCTLEVWAALEREKRVLGSGRASELDASGL